MRYYFNIIFLLLLLRATDARGQYYNTGQDPSRLKWLQIKTDRFTVIYPEQFGQAGIDFAGSLETAYSDVSRYFPLKKFRIPVIIHNYTTQANGYVAWAPKRMEIYPTPEQNTIPLDHNRQIAIHELTHVMQMESINSGFTRKMSLLFGEQFPGAVAALLPMWYMEGHAVYTESILTGSGRGRSPSFLKELKAITVEKPKLYSYDKMLNGSFRSYIPDHYQLGYQMVAWSLAKNDPDLWLKTLRTTGNFPFTLNPVNLSLRKNAGITKKRLFEETFDSLKVLWQRDITSGKTIKYESLNPEKKNNYINYYSPLFSGNDSIIAIKTSLKDPPALVVINPSKGTEKKFFTPGIMYPYYISQGAGKLLWVEMRQDPRWTNMNYSVIRILDLRTKLSRQLTFKTRFLAASISPDAELVAAVENTPANKNYLVLINPADGKVIESFPVPGNAVIQRPQWSESGQNITVIHLTEEGEGVLTFNLNRKEWSQLLVPGRNDLQSTYLRNDTLFFISSVSGTDDIYFLTPEQRVFKVTRTEFGASDMTISGAKVMFSNYSSTGNIISQTRVENASEYDNSVQASAYLINRTAALPGQYEYDPGTKLDPEPYRKWKHLFGLHSWMPFYADIEAIQSDPMSIRPGLTLMSQNQLSTMTSSFGYEYSRNNRHLFHTKVNWDGWYPAFETRFDYNIEQEVLKLNENVSSPDHLTRGFRITNTLYLPLTFTTGKFYHNLYPSLRVDYVNRYMYVKEEGNFDYGQTQITGRIYFSNYHLKAYRDIYPRWAQVVDLSFAGAPFDKLIYGTDLSFRTAAYFPGFIKNQGFRLRFEVEKQDFSKLLTGNRIQFPRAYSNIISEGLKFVSADYVAPLLYPDINIYSFIYLTRIRTNLFFDYAEGKNNYFLKSVNGTLTTDSHVEGAYYFRSYGVELLSDFHLFRIPFPVTAGIQAAWKKDNDFPAIKFIFNIDIYGMNIGGRGI